MTYFCVFKLSDLVFVKFLSFNFYLVNSEGDVYLPVDCCLVYSHPKMHIVYNIFLAMRLLL